MKIVVSLRYFVSYCSQQSLYHRQPYVNEIAVADTGKAYSNTLDGSGPDQGLISSLEEEKNIRD